MVIKFLTLNIWRGELLESAIKFFKEENPDILNLQEVYDGKDRFLPASYRSFEFLKKTFPEYSAVYGAQLCDTTECGNINEGNATYSKFPIISSEQTFFDIPYSTFDNHAKTSFEDNPQSVFYAKIDLGDEKINVFNVHGIWGFDGKDSPRRFKMVDTILEEIGEKENIILAGDFNMNPDTEAINKIANNLKSVFGDSLKSTFNMRHKKNPGYASAAVDMIFVSPNIRILEKKCPDVDVSDHLPLVTTLEI